MPSSISLSRLDNVNRRKMYIHIHLSTHIYISFINDNKFYIIGFSSPLMPCLPQRIFLGFLAGICSTNPLPDLIIRGFAFVKFKAGCEVALFMAFPPPPFPVAAFPVPAGDFKCKCDVEADKNIDPGVEALFVLPIVDLLPCKDPSF